MPLQNSGAISLSDVQTEFGGTNPVDIDEYYRGGGNVPDTAANSSIPTSGTIELDDFYGGDSSTGQSGPSYRWAYYGYGSDMGTIICYWRRNDGTLYTLRTLTGQQQNNATSAWVEYEEDLSAYAGQTGRIVYRYNPDGSFRCDAQLDHMLLRFTSLGDLDLDPSTTRSGGGWIKYNSTSSSSFPSFATNWSTVPTGSSTANIWNYDAGGTPSSSTGTTQDQGGSTTGYYIYYEGSSPNSNTNDYGWLAMSTDVTLIDPNTPTYIITPDVTSVNEGDTVSFTIQAYGVTFPNTVYWTTETNNAVDSQDFTDLATSGSFTLQNQTTTLNRTLRNDLSTEGTEIFAIALRSGSINGTILAQSVGITINDTSQEIPLFPFNFFQFTPCGQTGYSGPTSAQTTAQYQNESWYAQHFSNVNGQQRWTVPSTDLYTIVAKGASGGDGTSNNANNVGGNPAILGAQFYLYQGDVIAMTIGQKGANGGGSCFGAGGGGGGGTFVYNLTEGALYIAAGGGGGGARYDAGTSTTVQLASTTINGKNADGLSTVPGGVNGGGGSAAAGGNVHGCVDGGAGGGGYTSAGGNNGFQGGSQYFSSGTPAMTGGNSSVRDGGFGGGGSSSSYCGGGGGGYSGGAGGGLPSCSCSNLRQGGGGGSYLNPNVTGFSNNTEPYTGVDGHVSIYKSSYTGPQGAGGPQGPQSSAEFTFSYACTSTSNTQGTLSVYWAVGTTLNLLATYAPTGSEPWETAWTSYTLNLSAYSGQTGRIVFRYSEPTYFRGDAQLDKMVLSGTTAGTIVLDPATTQSAGGWERKTSLDTSYSSGTYGSVLVSTSASNVWNYDSGGTPSSGTGLTSDADGSSTGYYIYFESSSPNYQNPPSGLYGWLRMDADYTLN
jgi:hypothetical protein